MFSYKLDLSEEIKRLAHSLKVIDNISHLIVLNKRGFKIFKDEMYTIAFE